MVRISGIGLIGMRFKGGDAQNEGEDPGLSQAATSLFPAHMAIETLKDLETAQGGHRTAF